MLETLPQEMFERILSHCSRKDFFNISFCSRKCNNMVKPLIWSVANTSFCGCKRYPEERRINLAFTKKLCIVNTWYKYPPAPGTYRWRECSNCTRMCEEGEADAMSEAKDIEDKNFRQIIESCNVGKIRSISLRNVSTEGIGRCAEIFPNVYKLTIGDNDQLDWNCVAGMKKLSKLEVCTDEENPSGNTSFSHLLQLNKLSSILVSDVDETLLGWLSSCDRLTCLYLLETRNVSLEPLSMLRNLQSIQLQRASDNPLTISVRPLAALTELRNMTLMGYTYDGDSLLHFCRLLKKLNNLVLDTADDWYGEWENFINGYALHGDDFSEIHTLPVPRNLRIIGKCESLHLSCLEHISKSQSIQKFSMCIDHHHRDEKFYHLNKMDSLKELVLHGLDYFGKSIVDGILEDKQWNLEKKYRGGDGMWKDYTWTLTQC